MPDTFSPELNRLIREKMATGHYRSEEELLLDAVRALDDLQALHTQLRTQISDRLAKAGQGHSRPLDREAFKAEARRRLEAEG
jgi:Arc/MetJ-type ribon-helix-helix transcriptional regulator